MLSGFSFAEPRCVHMPFTLNKVSLQCEKGDSLIDKYFYVGIIDETSRDYVNKTYGVHENQVCNLDRDEETNPLYYDEDYFICDRDLDYSEFRRAVLGDGGQTGIEIPDM